MEAEPPKLHIIFLPFMAAGHMIPILDIAKLFSSHHVKITIITTPLNAPTFINPLKRYNNNISACSPIKIEIIPFPSSEVGLPLGLENFEQFTCPEMIDKFFMAIEMLQESVEQVVEKCKPNCFVADMLFPFATQLAAKFNIPRLVFHGTCFFALCVFHAFLACEPQKAVVNDDEEYLIPHLPHEIKLTNSQVPEESRQSKILKEFIGQALEAEVKSYGVNVNSFYEVEPDYADHYRKVLERRAWHIGPVSLCNRENEAKAQRGKDSSIDLHEWLKWLGSKKPNSVVYICFGSLSEVSNSQLHEIARGLEATGFEFIWVVRKSKEEEEDEDWLTEFEKSMEGKCLIIRGWAPQILILEQKAVGGFVTHCGWNSTLEGISSGVPMVNWLVFAE